MVKPEVFEKYKDLSDRERIKLLKTVINYDMPPLSVLFAMLIILEPERIHEILEKIDI